MKKPQLFSLAMSLYNAAYQVTACREVLDGRACEPKNKKKHSKQPLTSAKGDKIVACPSGL